MRARVQRRDLQLEGYHAVNLGHTPRHSESLMEGAGSRGTGVPEHRGEHLGGEVSHDICVYALMSTLPRGVPSAQILGPRRTFTYRAVDRAQGHRYGARDVGPGPTVVQNAS